MTMRIEMELMREEVELVTVHHRDVTLRKAFRNAVAAREWLAQRRAMKPVVQWSIETIWLVG